MPLLIKSRVHAWPVYKCEKVRVLGSFHLLFYGFFYHDDDANCQIHLLKFSDTPISYSSCLQIKTTGRGSISSALSMLCIFELTVD